MTDSITPQSIQQLLRASAKRLRLGIEGQKNADGLDALAVALDNPSGYIAKVGGASLRYDLCASSIDQVHAAALRSGLAPDNYTVQPFLVLHQ
jgi:hypothetical protein